MDRVIGLGAILFKCKDPELTKNWYKKHLNIGNNAYGHTFYKETSSTSTGNEPIEWCPFRDNTDYFNPSNADYIINYRVSQLEQLLILLKEEGIESIGKLEETEYGKFAWIMDPDGRKIELWEPLPSTNP